MDQVVDPATIEDPLQLVPWLGKVVHLALVETMAGRGNRILNQQLRSTARVIKALVPMERLRQAEALIKADNSRRAAEQLAMARAASTRAGRTTAAPTTSRPIR